VGEPLPMESFSHSQVLFRSSTGAGHEGGDDVGGVPVEGLSRPVVSHGGSWVGM
jgi:hypothetical protein